MSENDKCPNCFCEIGAPIIDDLTAACTCDCHDNRDFCEPDEDYEDDTSYRNDE